MFSVLFCKQANGQKTDDSVSVFPFLAVLLVAMFTEFRPRDPPFCSHALRCPMHLQTGICCFFPTCQVRVVRNLLSRNLVVSWNWVASIFAFQIFNFEHTALLLKFCKCHRFGRQMQTVLKHQNFFQSGRSWSLRSSID